MVRMDWIQDKFFWFIGVFGIGIFGGIFSVGKLYNRVSQLEGDSKIQWEKIDKITSNIETINKQQSEMIGKLDTLIEFQTKK